ncbi:hypothetical protein [Mycobacterium lepromatosis]|uniref:hypothetical protein n=1 Tax=Mycobacterium lepromatosis TaxID=480418 RepID=UPI0005F837AE|nr:hypothetical protein [Mycobacterium lepromatosis]
MSNTTLQPPDQFGLTDTGTGPTSTTNNQAAPYQQLRDRLHVLRLSAATEVPMGMLDDVQYQDLSTVAMLKQLLAVRLSANRIPLR